MHAACTDRDDDDDDDKDDDSKANIRQRFLSWGSNPFPLAANPLPLYANIIKLK